MQEVVMYVNAIDEINQAERASSTNSAERLRRAHEAAEVDWAVIPSNLREKRVPVRRGSLPERSTVVCSVGLIR